MPETRECEASHCVSDHTFQTLREKNTDFQVEAILLDLSEAERKKAPRGSAVYSGYVTELDSTSKIKRGTNGAQDFVYPEVWRPTKSNPNPPSVQTLVLRAMDFTSRALILDFGSLFLMVSLYPKVVLF